MSTKDDFLSYQHSYCPLCFSHFNEHGEGAGQEQRINILAWADDIVALYDRLQGLRSPEPEREVSNANS